MKLYHFTAGKFVRRIKQGGLIKGVMPISIKGSIAFIHDMQWLTLDPSYNQSWNAWGRGSYLNYDRTECRITVQIPKRCYGNLHEWPHIKRKLNILVPLNFDDFTDHSKWRVYIGRVEPSWLKSFDAKGEKP